MELQLWIKSNRCSNASNKVDKDASSVGKVRAHGYCGQEACVSTPPQAQDWEAASYTPRQGNWRLKRETPLCNMLWFSSIKGKGEPGKRPRSSCFASSLACKKNLTEQITYHVS